MSQYEYEKVEKPFIEELVNYGYTHYTGAQLDDERQQNHIILEKRFRAAIKRLNPWISEGNIDKVVHKFTAVTTTDLWEANRQIFEWLFGEGFTIDQDLGSGKKVKQYNYLTSKILQVRIMNI